MANLELRTGVLLKLSDTLLRRVDTIVLQRKQSGPAIVGNTKEEIRHAGVLFEKHREVVTGNQYLKQCRDNRKRQWKAGMSRQAVLVELIERGLASLESK